MVIPRSCTTICGTTTCPRSRCCSRFTVAAHRFRPSRSARRRWATSSCRPTRWRTCRILPVETLRCHRATCREKRRPRRSRFRHPAFRMGLGRLSANDAFRRDPIPRPPIVAGGLRRSAVRESSRHGDDHLAGEHRRRELVRHQQAWRASYAPTNRLGHGRTALSARQCARHGVGASDVNTAANRHLRICTPPPGDARRHGPRA